MIKKFAVAALLAALPVCAQAAPSITGATQGTGTITISGSGFGTKTQAAPIRFDTFEGLTPGNNISSETGWWQDSTVVDSRIKVSSTHAHGGTQSAVAAQTWEQLTIDGNPQAHQSDVGFATTRKVLVSMWVRWHWPEWTGGTPYEALQYKFFRVAAAVEPSGNVIYPHVAVFPWDDYGGVGIDRTLITSNSATLYSPNNHIVNDSWHHVMLLVDQGTKGNADGRIVSYWSKPSTSYITIQSATGVNIVGSAEDYLDDIKIDNYIDYNNPDLVASGATVADSGVYFDDIYIDNTFQRVEICDNATKATSTHCEIQPPTAWSDTGITVTLNQGTFETGDSVYVIAYNGSNEAGSYGPITLGSGLRRLGIRISE